MRGKVQVINVKGFCDLGSRIQKYFPVVDTFISSISNEDRYIRGFNLLSENNVSIHNKILFYYDQVLNISDREKTEAAFDKAFNIDTGDKKLYVDMYEEADGVQSFIDYFDSNSDQFENKNILIDLSVMVKPYFLLLLKHLSVKRVRRIGFIYTEPVTYFRDDPLSGVPEAALTTGAHDTREVPSFSGKYAPLKKQVLVVLLGFEGNRVMSVSNDINPERTIPVNGFPSFQPKFKDLSILNNRELLKDDAIFKNLEFAPAYDPFETKNTLNELYNKYSADHNFTIAHLGSKPMALGAGFFALEHTDCRIIYPYPQDYFPKSSYGWSKSWLYVAEIDYC